MKKRVLSVVAFVVLTLLNVGCSDHHDEEHNEHAHKEHKVHWGYTGHGSPYVWGEIDPAYKMCSIGKMQTPINIIATKNVDLPPISLNYSASSKNIINNGHSVQINVEEGSSLVLDGKVFELKQFHFHTPSENNLYGESYALEAHFVHATESGELAVIGVMFKKGEENEILSQIWSKFPRNEHQHIPFELSSSEIKKLMPENKDYYSFMGSLTTPPCTEGVHWIVYKNPLSISKEQVKRFFNLYGHSNNRPIQKSNDRTIYR